MALIATINGVPVYSDKQSVTTINTRIQFSDGSWCDVSTGEVHNTGPGYINIGGSDSGSNADKVTEGPKRVIASGLELRKLAADVTVQVYDGTEIEYTITGPSKKVEAIKAEVRLDTLVISGNGGESSFGGSIVSVGRSSVNIGGIAIGGGTFTIIGGGASSDTKVTVKVPKGTPVTSNHMVGDVSIGDIEADLTVNVQAGDVKAGRVKNARLHIQGSGDITIKEVDGFATVQIQGSGDVEIKNGFMPSLSVSIQGSGDVEVGGTAHSASLTVMGSGDIRVDHVVNEPDRTKMGSGKIRVRRIG